MKSWFSFWRIYFCILNSTTHKIFETTALSVSSVSTTATNFTLSFFYDIIFSRCSIFIVNKNKSYFLTPNRLLSCLMTLPPVTCKSYIFYMCFSFSSSLSFCFLSFSFSSFFFCSSAFLSSLSNCNSSSDFATCEVSTDLSIALSFSFRCFLACSLINSALDYCCCLFISSLIIDSLGDKSF